MINIKNLHPNKIKINEKSNKKCFFHCIRYVMMKDSRYVKLKSVNILYLTTNEINEHFEKIN